MMHKGIVRRGNHFVYTDNGGWILIDGPWFDRLFNYSPSRSFVRVRIPYTEPLSFKALDENLPPESDFKYVEWEAVSWHPGAGRAFRDPYVAHYLYAPYLKSRTRLGFRIVGDNWSGKDWATGVLPAYFNCALVVGDEWWSEELIRNGY
jgi:hypothetical protein